MNKQSLVDKIFKHFITDKNPPGYDTSLSTCTYINPPCAIGIFLTQDDLELIESHFGKANHTDEIESMINDVYSSGKAFSEVLNSFVEEETDEETGEEFYSASFLRELQNAHDQSTETNGSPYSPETFRSFLKVKLFDICNRHVLKFPGSNG